MALSPEEFKEITDEIMRRLDRKSVIAYGNPKFTGGKNVALDKNGLIDETLLPASALSTDADTLDGLDSTAFALAAHLHSGDDITTGTVEDARIASTIARDSEVAAAYSPLGHGHAFTEITGTATDAQIPAAIARDSEVAATYLPIASYTAADVLAKLLTVDTNTSTLNADTLDGVQGSGYALASHTQAMSTITDFVEGTWTPELRFGGVAPVGITYTSNTGIYSKIGKTVFASFDFTLLSKGAQAGNVAIYGLPLGVATIGTTGKLWWSGMTTAILEGGVRATNNWIEVHALTAAAVSSTFMTNTQMANTTRLAGSVVYRTI